MRLERSSWNPQLGVTLEKREIVLTSEYCNDVCCNHAGCCILRLAMDEFNIKRIYLEENETNAGYAGCPAMWNGAEEEDT